uniref:Uncharacterized protein n=1 Tax=Lepeophtheirus salmonis TaxID=72036 RepID=A0A0K2UVU1_LEPSM
MLCDCLNYYLCIQSTLFGLQTSK